MEFGEWSLWIIFDPNLCLVGFEVLTLRLRYQYITTKSQVKVDTLYAITAIKKDASSVPTLLNKVWP